MTEPRSSGRADGPRVLLNETGADGADLRALYDPPEQRWLRMNFVASTDGAATGSDGLSDSINNDVDKQVFDLLREICDVVVVGAGTARAEGYADPVEPLVVVTRQGRVPERLRESSLVHVATCGEAPGLAESQDLLGEDRVIVCGDDAVDLPGLVDALAERGWPQVLCEGGPHLHHDLLAEDLVDELDLTWSPMLVGGGGPRIVEGPFLDVRARPVLLLERDATLLGRWVLG